MDDPDDAGSEGGTDPDMDVPCTFVRHRNALVVEGSFGPVFTDYYLHLMQHAVHVEPEHDRIFKDALAAFTLYLASRPWKEVTAWTANFQHPRINLFVTGNSLEGNVVGRIFTEDIRERDQNLLYSEVKVKGEERRESIVEFEGTHFFRIAETFHARSDQRPARFFEPSPEHFVLVAAQPHCDLDWLNGLDEAAVLALPETEELSLLETRRYRFACGCSLDRIAPALVPLTSDDLDDLFAGAQHIEVTCPRCGAVFSVTRQMIEDLRP